MDGMNEQNDPESFNSDGTIGHGQSFNDLHGYDEHAMHIKNEQKDFENFNTDSTGMRDPANSLVSNQLTENPKAIVISKQKHDGFQLRITKLEDNYNVRMLQHVSEKAKTGKKSNFTLLSLTHEKCSFQV